MKLWQKYDTIKNLPFKLSTDDLYNIQYELMAYLRGKLQFLETKVTIDGVLTDFYSIRSKVHMADVRFIFQYFTYACFIAIACAIFSLFKIKNADNAFRCILKSYRISLAIYAIIFFILLTCAIINFDAFFTRFHEVLFDNDFWLLDPREDFIICLLPESIFMEIGIIFSIIMAILLGLFGFLCRILSKIQQNPEAR